MKKTTLPPGQPPAEVRADWLLRFLGRDLAEIRLGQVIGISADVVEYLLDPRAVVAEGAEAVIALKEIAKEERFPRPAGIPYSEEGTEEITEEDVITLPRTLLQKLQETLRNGMDRLDKGEEWLPYNTPPQIVMRKRADGTLGRSYYAGPIMPVLIASALDLLVEVWPRIARCKHGPCNKWFRQEHGRQLFCDPKHAGLYRQHKLKHRNKERENALACRREARKKEIENAWKKEKAVGRSAKRGVTK